MGHASSQVGLLFFLMQSLAFASAAVPKPDLGVIRGEINAIERELLRDREGQSGAQSQLKKIRKLLKLQQQEIRLSKKKIEELNTSMGDLSAQKLLLIEKIEKQKASLRLRLRELYKLSDKDAMDASWIYNQEIESQKSYFLAKTLRRDMTSVDQLKKNVQEALALELKILEEKNKLDYYVHELSGQAALLTANEEVQREILKTNKSNRLEAMHRIQTLRESERELETMISSFRESGAVDLSFAGLKGRLPFPADGSVLSQFGKSYNSKTNLLTFQKGITIGTHVAAGVRAVADGRVVFAGPLKNYGLIAIVEHPGQYFTLYGQMGGVSVAEGNAVKRGDVLGKTAGEPLYFEIRNKNIAVNPMAWMLTASR